MLVPSIQMRDPDQLQFVRAADYREDEHENIPTLEAEQ